MKKPLCVIIAVILSMLVACDSKDSSSSVASTSVYIAEPENVIPCDTLNVGYSPFSGEFDPFYAVTSNDRDVVNMVFVSLLTFDNNGNLLRNAADGEKVTVNGKEYEHIGIANVTETVNIDGSEVYEFELRDDIRFSDGEILNADDVIFSMYVLSDPSYNGPSAFSSLPILGMEEYRDNSSSLYEIIISDTFVEKESDESNSNYNIEQREFCCEAFYTAGVAFAQAIVDHAIANYGDYGVHDVYTAAALRGYSLRNNATVNDFCDAIFENYNFDIDSIESEFGGISFRQLFLDAFGVRKDEFCSEVKIQNNIGNIKGIEKTGEYSFKILLTDNDSNVYSKLSILVAPLHYYGDEDAYDYENDKFGFVKGDVLSLESENKQPLGAGPYVFKSYEKGTVAFERNALFYKGVPKTKYVNFIEVNDVEKVNGVISGDLDIVETQLDASARKLIEIENGGVLIGDVAEARSLKDFGYGYIGICADNVKVGGDKDSDASKNLRKAFATLFSIHRDDVLFDYFADNVITNYPVSGDSWISPSPADEGYEVAFSRDVDGNPLYTFDMTDQQKYDTALNASIGFLKAAGYIYDETLKEFIAAPAGASLRYEIIIPANGNNDHPAYGILDKVKSTLGRVGIELIISNPTDSGKLWEALSDGECEMWVAAWSFDWEEPSMYQLYHSESSNYYGISDETIDSLIEESARSNEDIYKRSLYKECFDLVLDWAVEVPLYQNQNYVVFSSARINTSAFTFEGIAASGWIDNVHLIEMNPIFA